MLNTIRTNSDMIVKPYEIRKEDIPVFCTPDMQDYKCSYIPKYEVTLFPDHNQYDTNSNWKAIADKWEFEISRDYEIWHEQGLISKGDDIADYYFNNNSPP